MLLWLDRYWKASTMNLADEGVEAAWNEEIKRRIEEIDSGKVQMIPYEEVRRRLAALLSDASK